MSNTATGAVMAIKTGLYVVTNKNIKPILAAMKALADTDVLVGIPGEKTQRGEPITNAAIGYIMENGAPEVNIPARPWLLPGIKSAQKLVVNYFKQAGVAAMDGNTAKVDRVMHAAGIVAADAARRKINSNIPPPLAPRTIAARLARGRTGTKTLVDTGQLRNSVTYVVRNKKTGTP